MGNLFGKKTKVTRITEQDKAVLVCCILFSNNDLLSLLYLTFVY